MISMNVHCIEDIKVEPVGKIFQGSYCRTIKIRTSEVDNIEIYLFADKPDTLTRGLVQDTRIAGLFDVCEEIQEYLEQRSDVDNGIPNEENKLAKALYDALEKTEVLL